jgi:hypothetical protein
MRFKFKAISITAGSVIPGLSSYMLLITKPFSLKIIVLERGKFSFAKNITKLILENKALAEYRFLNRQKRPLKPQQIL